MLSCRFIHLIDASRLNKRFFLHAFQILVRIGCQATALALPDHRAQTLHDGVVGLVARAQVLTQVVNGRSNTSGLVNRALLLNGQGHG